jgi:YesN/AraC family two-component response regulator
MGNYRILIADDSQILLKILELILKQICPDCRIVTTADGLAALAKVQQPSISPTFDLIFTDYEMPGMNGLELSQAVYDSHPDIKVVLMTGHSYVPGLNGAGRPANLIGLLKKPFSKEEVERTFKMVLDSSQDEV